LSAVFQEGMSLIARDRSAAYFSDSEEGAQILVCSEIGSEGRNFQFAHHLVLFDLPLNPDLLEQRIGRLDRIGQKHTVQIHAPYYESSAQAVLLAWYHEGINAIECTCPAGQILFEYFEQDLIYCMKDAADKGALDTLLHTTRRKSEDTLRTLQQGRDRLLEMNSFNAARADEVIHNLVAEERRDELAGYMEQVFDQFGVEQEQHTAHSLVLRPGDHMLVPSFPGLAEDGMTATYQRELALSREDIHFLTWEHPMVSGAMDMVLNGEFGNTALCAISLSPYKPGSILTEVIFTLSGTAPVELQLSRYLPLTTVRVVVDYSHNDLSEMLSNSLINRLSRKVPRAQAQDLVRHTLPKITTMVSSAESLAADKKNGIVDDAVAAMQAQQLKERQRLHALAETNPNISQEEIENMRNLEERLQHYLDSAQLRLDAIRVIVISD
jgi:ATP-dependent helicase HepA